MTVKLILEYTIYTKVVVKNQRCITSFPAILDFEQMNGMEIYHHNEDRLQDVYRTDCSHPLSLPPNEGYIRMRTFREPRDGYFKIYFILINFIFKII